MSEEIVDLVLDRETCPRTGRARLHQVSERRPVGVHAPAGPPACPGVGQASPPSGPSSARWAKSTGRRRAARPSTRPRRPIRSRTRRESTGDVDDVGGESRRRPVRPLVRDRLDHRGARGRGRPRRRDEGNALPGAAPPPDPYRAGEPVRIGKGELAVGPVHEHRRGVVPGSLERRDERCGHGALELEDRRDVRRGLGREPLAPSRPDLDRALLDEGRGEPATRRTGPSSETIAVT